MIERSAIREAVDVQVLLDRLVASAGPLDAHPLQVDGNAHRELEQDLVAVIERWVRDQGVLVK